MSPKLKQAIAPTYHKWLAYLAALWYHFPSRDIHVVGITGTKGKSSTAEMVNAILEEAGIKTVLIGTIKFKIAGEIIPNKMRMTMPGRFLIQQMLHEGIKKGATWAVIEMTSQGAVQNRHKYIESDALIFTNLSPEHIESHGSFENYRAAKVAIAEKLARSTKEKKTLVVNGDDEASKYFLAVPGISEKLSFSAKDAEPISLRDDGSSFMFKGQKIETRLAGKFNVMNMLAAATFADSIGIAPEIIKRALEKITLIRGRAEQIKGNGFTAVVDYAHTTESLKALYNAFPNAKKICVLGNTGGGRDKWKRPAMAKVAEDYCDEIILTNEDPYDEDPREIVREMEAGLTHKKADVIMDRREAITTALSRAQTGDFVLITGKGTDPCICGPNGTQIPWDDATVVREEIAKMTLKQK